MSKKSRDKNRKERLPPAVVYAAEWYDYEAWDVISLHFTREGAEKALKDFEATTSKDQYCSTSIMKREVLD